MPFLWMLLGIKSKALHILGNCTTTELHPLIPISHYWSCILILLKKKKNQELYFDFLKYIFSVHCCFTTFQCYHFVYAICVSVCYNILFYRNTQLIILVFILTLNLQPTLFYLTFVPCSTLFQDDWVDFLQVHLVHFCDPFLQLYLADPKETNG